MDCRIRDGKLQITMAGACIAQNLAPLLALLSAHAEHNINITINVEKVSATDSAFLGLLTLVCGQQLNRGKSLKIVGQNRTDYSFDVLTESV